MCRMLNTNVFNTIAIKFYYKLGNKLLLEYDIIDVKGNRMRKETYG